MTGIKLKYTTHVKDGSAHCKVLKVNEGDEFNNDFATVEVHENCNQILQPIKLGIPAENIISLLISNCQLSYLPNQFNFCNLIELDISHNYFQYIPDIVLNDNENLQKLNASVNKIIDFHLSPKCYKKLKDLNLKSNLLTAIPAWIFYSSSELENLDLGNNPLNDPGYFLSGKNLTKLYTLELSNCNINKNYKFLDEIPNLKKLSMTNYCSKENVNSIHELPFGQFASSHALVELNFTQMGFSCLSEDIGELQSLEILNVSHNCISWLPEKFTKLKLLQVLDISHNELLALPLDIGELNNLIELHLAFNVIGTLPESMKKLKKLKLLDCYHNDLIDNAFNVINQIPSLTALDMEQNYFCVKENGQHSEMRNNIWKSKPVRIVGCRTDMIYDDRTDSRCSISDEEIDQMYEINKSVTNEENWDSNSDGSISSDSLLFLPPYRCKIIRKPMPYDPSDYIHPMYFEDALEDET